MDTIDLSRLRLPAISETGLQILDMISAEEVNLMGLSKTIAHDPVLSGTLLRYANSPLYRRHVEVTNVRNAISLLGINNVRLAVVVATMRALSKKGTPTMELVWGHSFRIGNLAKALALKCSRWEAEDIELTAVIHDIGALVLAVNYPEEYAAIVKRSLKEGRDILSLEAEVLNATRAQLLDGLADNLRLPEPTHKALVRFYAMPVLESVDDMADRQVAILYLSHLIDSAGFGDATLLEAVPQDREALCRLLDLNEEDIEGVIEQVFEPT